MKSSSGTAPPDDRRISSQQMALLSGAVFDIPPRTRWLIAVAGAAGIVVVVEQGLFEGVVES
jgi:hypothetical protein